MRHFAPLLFTAITLMIFACSPQPAPEVLSKLAGQKEACPPEGFKLIKNLNQNSFTVPLDTAELWANNWGKALDSKPGFLQDSPLYGFTIPHQDLAGLIKSPGARAYLGIMPSGEYKVVFVGVDSLGNDDLNFVYDLTTPCPPTCDTSSVLYKSFLK